MDRKTAHCVSMETETERILIRELRDRDLAAFTCMRNDERIYRCEPTFLAELQGTPENAFRSVRELDLLRDRQCILGIYEPSDPETLIGLAEFYDYKPSGIAVSIGYRLLPEYWGRGLGTQVVHDMLDSVRKNTEAALVTAHVMPENIASSRCLLKNGFEFLLTKEEDWGFDTLTVADVYTFDC